MKEVKKIMIFGNKGMLGHDLCDELTPDYEVIGFDIENCDITDREQILKSIGQSLPDVVINCAAYTDVDGCETQVQKAFSVNADGSLFVSQACSEYNVRLFFLSTDYVFDGSKETPYVEEDKPDPVNVYGRSKLKGEQYIERTISDFVCIRTSGLYGINGKSFVRAILNKVKSEPSLRVVSDQKCSPTYTRDLAVVVKKLIMTDFTGFLNVVNPDGCSWFDFAKEILKLSGMEEIAVTPISSEELDLLAPRPKNSILSNRKLESELGISMRHMTEALADFLKELKDLNGT